MISDIVFDFGGVVVGYDPAGYVRGLFGEAPVGRFILDTVFDSALVGRLDLGFGTRRDEYKAVLERAGAEGYLEETQYVIDHWIGDMMGTREDTVGLIRELRAAGYGVWYLTNMPADLWEVFTARGLRDEFMGGVASFEVHLTKPDRRIYELLFSDCGLDPARCVFLDDMERNLTGARDAGMEGILYRDAAGARQALRGLGVRI